jgi:hypothetical protein
MTDELAPREPTLRTTSVTLNAPARVSATAGTDNDRTTRSGFEAAGERPRADAGPSAVRADNNTNPALAWAIRLEERKRGSVDRLEAVWVDQLGGLSLR